WRACPTSRPATAGPPAQPPSPTASHTPDHPDRMTGLRRPPRVSRHRIEWSTLKRHDPRRHRDLDRPLGGHAGRPWNVWWDGDALAPDAEVPVVARIVQGGSPR
ncbi:MAG TPA: hypothetical protein PLB21_03070, partial [Actinomycetota bacterium]|nr:hypothetical protein [Actinomycetota bacterium]